MNEKANNKKINKVALALGILFAVLIVASRFLWAFTLWYEWIALGLASLVFLAMIPFMKKAGKDDEE